MSPIFAFVIQTLVEHVHNLIEVAGTKRSQSAIASITSVAGAYLLNVRAAISAISVPVGPHGSLDVAVQTILGLEQIVMSLYTHHFEPLPAQDCTPSSHSSHFSRLSTYFPLSLRLAQFQARSVYRCSLRNIGCENGQGSLIRSRNRQQFGGEREGSQASG